ncbi:nucleolar complex protein 2 homolog [Palaemon carinicauda]|uniref:nucleolar complex protein 2 homolog n=1 Tax=Palaemon carinicauda TaxID=392227 RepID=UPI0035B656F9
MKLNTKTGKGKFNKKKGQPGKKKGGQSPKMAVKKKKQEEIANMSVDDMFTMIQEDDTVVDDGVPSTQKKKEKKSTAKKTKASKVKEADPDEEEDESSEDEGMADASSLSQKEYLNKLKETDPEFYSAMMQSSELMDLKSSDEEEEEESGDEKDVKQGSSPQGSEEEDSDGSEFDFEDTKGQGGNITSQMIEEWEKELRSDSPMEAFMEVQQAFLAAIESLSGGKKESVEKTSRYVVKGSQNFNAVVRLCLRNMVIAMRTFFKIKDKNQLPSTSKRWSRHKNCIKLYLRQMIALTEVVAEPTVAETVLRNGVLPLIPYYAGHKSMSKLLARRLVTMWATSDKKVRVLAFMAAFRLTQILQGDFLEWMLKKMYIAYVQNSRFTSPSTWGLIDFMRVSLVELYTLDFARAYRHAFIYIRQMAIHLRNAIILPKKDRVQLVYNWQFIHCLNLWCDLLGKTHPNAILQPMIFPVTQVAIGTMKLQPTQTFFPLAFHICRILTELSRKTGTFIPVLPFLLEILNKAVFFKQPKKTSVRPFNWMCILRLSRGELKESAFKDGVVDQVYDGMVNYLSVVSSSIGFPDFVVPTVIQLKAFLKKCKSPNYCKKFKQLLDKIRENCDFIEDRRKDVKFGIADLEAVKNWEVSVKQTGTPFNKYYDSWHKIRQKEFQQQMADSVSVPDYDLPSVKKRKLQGKGDMYSSDEEDDDDSVRSRGDNEEESEEEESKNANDPPKKKTKVDEENSLLDLATPIGGSKDVVREFTFSDDEDEPLKR